MALQTQFLSSFTNKAYNLQQHTLLFFSSTQPNAVTVRSQKPSESSKPTTNLDDTTPVSVPVPPQNSPGVGFGSSNANAAATGKRKPQKGRRERASIIRRSPVQKPAFVSEKQASEVDKKQGKNESAFILAWLGFGVVILVEGISLAASGFLPEEWDKFFVKYLYPSFTPTVFLFVAGAVAYGAFKYIQNEKITGQK